MKLKTKAQRLVYISLMTAVAISLNVFESFIPITIAVPGVKLGLANVVSLVALSLFSFPEVLLIIILRTLLSATFYGSYSALMFSMAGGVLSLIAMALLFRFKDKGLSTIGISVIGAIFHNIGQVTVAALILQSSAIYSYLAVLLVSSVITGILIGVVGGRAIQYLSAFQKNPSSLDLH